MWPGFNSRRRRHMWVEFVVGSLPCSERFFSGYSSFPLSSKTNISKFQFDQESGRRRTTMWMCYLQIVIYFYLFIYLFIYNSLLAEYITGWVMYKFRRGQNAEPYSMFQVSWRPKSCLSPGCIKTQITRALRKKQRLYRKARRSGTDKSWAPFKRHRRSVDRHKRRRQHCFISNVYEPCWKRTTQSSCGIILNPWIGMFLEFQRWKHLLATLLHPLSLKQTL